MKNLWRELTIGTLGITLGLVVHIWTGQAEDINKIDKKVDITEQARLADHDSIVEMRTNIINIYNLLSDIKEEVKKKNEK